MQNENSFACSNLAAATVGWCYLMLECLNGGLAGRDGERLTWGRWQRKQKKKKKTEGVVERREKPTVALGGRLVVVLASCDAAGGGCNGEEKRESETDSSKGKILGRKAGFRPTLGPIFSSLRPWNSPLFIGSRRGQSCLHQEKISSPWFDWKNPNCWFKVCTLNCQIWQFKAARVSCFRLVTGAVLMFIGQNGWYSGIEGFHVTILVHVLSILGDIRGIKCTCKTATQAAFTRKTMNND